MPAMVVESVERSEKQKVVVAPAVETKPACKK